MHLARILGGVLVFCLGGCSLGGATEAADLILHNARVYSLNWPEPSRDGQPDPSAPHGPAGWTPDATAVAIRGDRIIFVGSDAEALHLANGSTRTRDLAGATLLPGLIESHTHAVELGRNLRMADLVGVKTEDEAIARVRVHARKHPDAKWILGHGWDEGAWADRYPDMAKLSRAFPKRPVVLRGLHGFAVWGNAAAFAAAGINRDTEAPSGGDIIRDQHGNPSGVLTNRATELLSQAIPIAAKEEREAAILAGLDELARSGYVAVHEAGVDAQTLADLEGLSKQGRLPLHFYAMLSARDSELCRSWQLKGPDTGESGKLKVRAVKAFFDGALGSRGASLLTDYADQSGHRGVAGAQYQFDQDLVADMMRAGFQVCIHAIGDAGNRQTLDFIAAVQGNADGDYRHRIEHAQVLHPEDMPRFAALGVIASMEPPHAMEDKAWAEARLGPERVLGAYAWRSLRENGARLCFNSDLPGSDWNIFYGLHSAVTRQDKTGAPAGGWYPEQAMSIEESIRGYSSWGAYAGFAEDEAGVLAKGMRADITVMDIDPFDLAAGSPESILAGNILMTLVSGEFAFDRGDKASKAER